MQELDSLGIYLPRSNADFDELLSTLKQATETPDIVAVEFPVSLEGSASTILQIDRPNPWYLYRCAAHDLETLKLAPREIFTFIIQYLAKVLETKPGLDYFAAIFRDMKAIQIMPTGLEWRLLTIALHKCHLINDVPEIVKFVVEWKKSFDCREFIAMLLKYYDNQKNRDAILKLYECCENNEYIPELVDSLALIGEHKRMLEYSISKGKSDFVKYSNKIPRHFYRLVEKAFSKANMSGLSTGDILIGLKYALNVNNPNLAKVLFDQYQINMSSVPRNKIHLADQDIELFTLDHVKDLAFPMIDIFLKAKMDSQALHVYRRYSSEKKAVSEYRFLKRALFYKRYNVLKSYAPMLLYRRQGISRQTRSLFKIPKLARLLLK